MELSGFDMATAPLRAMSSQLVNPRDRLIPRLTTLYYGASLVIACGYFFERWESRSLWDQRARDD